MYILSRNTEKLLSVIKIHNISSFILKGNMLLKVEISNVLTLWLQTAVWGVSSQLHCERSNHSDVQWEASGSVDSQGMEFLTSQTTVTQTHRVRAESMSSTSFAKCFLCFWIFGISTWEERESFHLSLFVGVKEDEEQTQYCQTKCTCSSVDQVFALMTISLLADLHTNQHETHVPYIL